MRGEKLNSEGAGGASREAGRGRVGAPSLVIPEFWQMMGANISYADSRAGWVGPHEIMAVAEELGAELLDIEKAKRVCSLELEENTLRLGALALECIVEGVRGRRRDRYGTKDRDVAKWFPLKGVDPSPDGGCLLPAAIDRIGWQNCTPEGKPETPLGRIGRRMPETLFSLKLGGGWAVTSGFTSGDAVRRDQVFSLAITKDGVLNDSPMGKAALRVIGEFGVPGSNPVGCAIVEEAHFSNGVLWNPDAQRPALFFRRDQGAAAAYLIDDKPGRVPSTLPNIETFFAWGKGGVLGVPERPILQEEYSAVESRWVDGDGCVTRRIRHNMAKEVEKRGEICRAGDGGGGD